MSNYGGKPGNFQSKTLKKLNIVGKIKLQDERLQRNDKYLGKPPLVSMNAKNFKIVAQG